MGENLAHFFKSFVYAGRGIARALRQEQNLRFDLCAGAYVFAFSLFYGFSAGEYALLAALVFGVLALESLNSAIERAVDCAGEARTANAKAAKDMAAGAVLLFCLGAAVGGVSLFWDVAVFKSIGAWFLARPWMLAVLAASLAAGFWFVFLFGERRGEKHGQ